MPLFAPLCIYILFSSTCKKVKWPRYRPGVTQTVGRGIALLFHDCGTRRGWMVSSTLRPHFTPGKDLVPIVQQAGWAPGPVWRAENLVPTGIRSQTFQPVVSRYTDWATGPAVQLVPYCKYSFWLQEQLYYLFLCTLYIHTVCAILGCW